MKVGIYFDKKGGMRGGPYIRGKLLEKYIPWVETFNDIDKAKDYDLLDLQWRVPSRLTTYDYVSTHHGFLPLKYCSNLHAKASMFLRTMEQKGILKNAQKVIAVSHESKRQLIDIGISEHKIKIIYAGIEIDNYENNAKKNKVMFLNSLEKYENLQVIINALKYNPMINFNIDVYGYGRLQDYYENQIKEYNLPINILEEVSNETIKRELSSTKVVVQPALQETFGLPICESMASGSIAIVSDIQSHRENFENVLFFEPTDYKTLAKLMVESINGKYDYLIPKALQEVQKKYNIKKFIKETKKIYEDMLYEIRKEGK